MSDNTLYGAIDGTTIQAADVNQYKTAITGDSIPRDVTTNAPTTLAGSIGSFAYKWLNGWVNKLWTNKVVLGDTEYFSPDIVNDGDGARYNTYNDKSHSTYIDGVLKSNVTTSGLDGAYLEDSSVTPIKQSLQNTVTSASSGSFYATSTTDVTITNLSVTLTKTSANRATMLIIHPGDVSLGVGTGAGIFNAQADVNIFYLSFYRDGTLLSENLYEGPSGTGASSTSYTPNISILDTGATGAHTYSVKIRVQYSFTGTTGGVNFTHMKLKAVEL